MVASGRSERDASGAKISLKLNERFFDRALSTLSVAGHFHLCEHDNGACPCNDLSVTLEDHSHLSRRQDDVISNSHSNVVGMNMVLSIESVLPSLYIFEIHAELPFCFAPNFMLPNVSAASSLNSSSHRLCGLRS